MTSDRPARDEPTLEDALDLAIRAHRGQTYASPDSQPYILHPLRVMLGVTSRTAQIVALLHDVVEDSEFTLRDLAERGFDAIILDAIDCLSRRPNEEYARYISRVASNPLAREVKLSDLADNLANNQALPSTPDNLARIVRYEQAQRVLGPHSNHYPHMNGDPLMSTQATVGLLTAAWRDLDRLLSHVGDDIAISQPGPGRASVAWTVAHLANQVDGWINVRFGGVAPHPLLSDRHWRMGSDGSAEDWSSIRSAASEVRAAALAYLAGLSEQDLDGLIAYHGSLPKLTGRTVSLRYAIARVAAHTYFHVGAMAADLVVAGLSVGDYPGAMEEALPQ